MGSIKFDRFNSKITNNGKEYHFHPIWKLEFVTPGYFHCHLFGIKVDKEFDVFPLTERELWLPEFHTSFSTHFGISNNSLNIQSEGWSEGLAQSHPVPNWWPLVLPYLSLWCNPQPSDFYVNNHLHWLAFIFIGETAAQPKNKPTPLIVWKSVWFVLSGSMVLFLLTEQNPLSELCFLQSQSIQL